MKKYLIIIISLLFVLTLSAKNPVALISTNMGDITVELWPKIAPKTVSNFIGLSRGTKKWLDPKSKKWVKRKFYDGLIFHRVIKNFMIQAGCPLGNGSGGPGYAFDNECYEPGKELKGKIADPKIARRVMEEILIPYLRANQSDLSKVDQDILGLFKEASKIKDASPLMKHPIEYYIKKVNFKGKFTTRGKLKATVDYGTICMANAGVNTNGSQFFIVTDKNGRKYLNGGYTVFGKVTKGMEVAHRIETVPVNHDKNKGAIDKPFKNVVINKITIK